MMYIILVAIIIYLVYSKRKSSKNVKPISTEETQLESINNAMPFEYTGKYQKKYLLTKNEYSEYKKLKEYANIRNLQICPKVRLLDLIEPKRGEPKYKTLFYKIQAKHVDFVICDQNLYIKAIVELDDNSHNQTDRKTRDEFVDSVLKDVGYTVIRTRSITETTLDVIK